MLGLSGTYLIGLHSNWGYEYSVCVYRFQCRLPKYTCSTSSRLVQQQPHHYQYPSKVRTTYTTITTASHSTDIGWNNSAHMPSGAKTGLGYIPGLTNLSPGKPHHQKDVFSRPQANLIPTVWQ